MNQDIRYKGLSLTPDELAAENGTLAVCGNAELHDGALRPSVIDGTLIEFPLQDNQTNPRRLVFAHKTASYTHYICVDEDGRGLCWFDQDSDGDCNEISDFDYTQVSDTGMETPNAAVIVQVEAIGNTLVVLATNGKHYVLWKNDLGGGTAGYKYLGQQPPYVQMEFCMGETIIGQYDRSTVNDSSAASYRAYRRTGISSPSGKYDSDSQTFDDEVRSTLTNEAWALVNQTHEYITRQGNFYTNFYVRYCYRLYDGSTLMHSAPIFMPVALPNSVRVGVVNLSSGTTTDTVIGEVNLSGGTMTDNVTETETETSVKTKSDGKLLLSYKPINAYLMKRFATSAEVPLDALQSDWSDIVTSVDLFVSPPLLRIQDNEPVQKVLFTTDVRYKIYFDALNTRTGVVGKEVDTHPTLDMHEQPDTEYFRRVRDCSTFYKVMSYPLAKLTYSNQYSMMNLSHVLPALYSQEAMTDDYNSHHALQPILDGQGGTLSRMYMYNRRLHLSAIRERLFDGFAIGGLMPPCNIAEMIDSAHVTGTVTVNSIVWTLATEDGIKTVRRQMGSGVDITVWCLCHSLYFYPDTRATKAVVNYTKNSNQYHYEVELEPCLALNGAMCKRGLFGLNSIPQDDGSVTPGVDALVTRPNVVYTSEADNPFRFPVGGILTVGTGTVLGMAATTRAISQGQFGQYPLMVFATDGIWALDVTGTGTYRSIHPISREVCSNARSICQIDQQVVFATARGLYVLTEQNVTPISAMLDGVCRSVETIAPGLMGYFDDKPAVDALLSFAADEPPVSYFQEATVVYDFASNRLLVYKPEEGSTQPLYVFSISDHTWSTMVTASLWSTVPGYPYPYLETRIGHAMVLDKAYPYASTTVVPTIVVTRALTWGDAIHAIGGIIHHKMMARKTMLFVWGSNDLSTWHYVGRTNQEHVYYLPAHSYKYYRIALYNEMTPGETYIQTSIDVREKYPKV